MYFNISVPMEVESPILWPGAIPETDAVQSRQYIVWNSYSRIMALAERRQPDFTSSDSKKLRFAGVNAAILHFRPRI